MKGFVITFTRQIASLDYCAYPATPKVRSGPGGGRYRRTDCVVLLSVASSLQRRTMMAQTARHCSALIPQP